MSRPSDSPRRPRQAQSVHIHALNHTRWLLFLMGIFMTVVCGCPLATDQEDGESKQAARTPTARPADPEAVQTAPVLWYMRWYIWVAGKGCLGPVFVVLAGLIRLYPVPVSVTSLALVVLLCFFFTVFVPAAPLISWILRIAVILVLARGVRAAVAYEREKAEADDLAQDFV